MTVGLALAAPASAQIPPFSCPQGSVNRFDYPVIAIGGRGSQVQGVAFASGIFDTACFLDPGVRAFGLPADPFDVAGYAAVEASALVAVRGALSGGHRVALLGYSYGATAALRIVYALNAAEITRVTLVLLDRVSFLYPLTPYYDAVPTGLERVLNVYQTLAASTFRGAPLAQTANVTNINVGQDIATERSAAVSIQPFPFSAINDHHVYIDHSEAVRRFILGSFGVNYLGGIWRLRLRGTVSRQNPNYRLDVDVTQDFVGNEQPNGPFTMLRRSAIPGSLDVGVSGTQRNGVLAGGFTFDGITFPSCYINGQHTGRTDDFRTATFNLTATYDCINPGQGPVPAMFSGTVNGALIVEIAGVPSGSSEAPGAPFNHSVTVLGSTVTLVWNGAAANAAAVGVPTSYRIQVGSGPGLTNLADFNTGSSTTSFTASNVPAGTYYSRVRAVNAAGTSQSSNEATFSVGVGAGGAAGSPRALRAMVSGRSVVLNWDAPATGPPPTTYVIEAGSNPGASNLAMIQINGSILTLSAVAPPGTYFVRVRAANAAGTSLASNEIIVTVQ